MSSPPPSPVPRRRRRAEHARSPLPAVHPEHDFAAAPALIGPTVRLEQLDPAHAPGLALAAAELGDLWVTDIPAPDGVEAEIGSTWLSPRAHGRRTNPEVKLMLLTRAFDELDCIAVEFRTHFHNHHSRRAIEKLGAKQDGILRSHQLHRGVLRDTVVYSIIAAEWPTVRLGLEQRLLHG